MKIAFFGTPEYVVPIFEYLLKNEHIICVVTRADKPVGRHLQHLPSPIKKKALQKNIPVLTPENLKDNDFISKLSTLNSELAIVAAYGKILPKEVLDMFPSGCVNLHFSILPKYRGAAPIQWAIIKGEKETGVTGFFMDEGLDTGKIIFQKKIEIAQNEDSLSLQKKLIPVAIDVLSETLEKVKKGFKGEAQTGKVSYAPPLKKSDGKIDWNRPAGEIHNLIRGTKPWPAAYTEVGSLKILDAETSQSLNLSISQSLPVGSIVSIQKNVGFIVKCNPGFLLIKTVQPASKNVMTAWSFLLGYKLAVADKLS
ncbi:MAG: methionyl-tRNA formyltransferase [Elusimicrobia bacterium CG06_land_8_20_14_3_00_38_11]|nr:MAG: methionyl-tRNA formyltransferase [Elusimicrobia bacterium CG06_land_8_20_14_3_00_38_11]